MITARNKKEVEENQINEIKGLESKFNSEMEVFNKEQDVILQNFEQEARKQEELLKNRQIKEMDELYKDFEDEYATKVIKYSKQVLEMKNTEEQLVKQQRYNSTFSEFIR